MIFNNIISIILIKNAKIEKDNFIMSDFYCSYTVVEDNCQVEDREYTGYGICVKEFDSKYEHIFRDISRCREEVEKLAELCNELELDPIHIEDVICDFLG